MSKKCLRCEYVRQPTDTAPEYECPSCGVIYAKFEASRGIVSGPSSPSTHASSSTPNGDVVTHPPVHHPQRRNVRQSFVERDNFVDELRENSLYPAFRTVTKFGAFFGYFIAGLLVLSAITAVFKSAGWQAVLGLLAAGAVIAVTAKVFAEASNMAADAADALVHSGCHLNKS